MADYHFVYKDVEGASTQSIDIQRKLGNLLPSSQHLSHLRQMRTLFPKISRGLTRRLKKSLRSLKMIWMMIVSLRSTGVALVFCQSDPVLKDGQSKNEQSREAVIEVRSRFLEKVVTEHEDNDDGSSSD
ncbi:hypothetical protein L6164_009022 [Bauhinia variegata]|uniref:Uncharacterized protein n=1 Tax=Bauhinia variegata TaxID=167791 RepID=A0ACB9PLD2_BAUVA|nr:hypothetical protein L6164_009022 [Bauhinia variegata]